ncbi:Kiwa anti-phage protein KwaB-like domain-containing protein [Pontibacillus litoralis]|uniref:DUF4868 domain-containing protein n=1 Tax=Pontibacillus litoralis JSM 072002 TaxID=1385512 RepID=A0A0A5G4K1_9BACI|nr:Kiwa anti-phage protein KwaB-like domain-containing protein [Pontibacillus litoralis]KGX88031.1 hypothetical protein N784_12960 [Pontibacillus litoralis JSM 072002]
MVLNNKDNFVNKLSEIEVEELEKVDLSVFLVSKVSETDALYNVKREQLDLNLMQWVKKNIKKELNNLKYKDENGKQKFFVSEYNDELTKKDYIAKLDLNSDEALKNKKNKLVQSLNRCSTVEDNNVKFQVIKLTLHSESAYFIYYRGVKLSAMNKKSVKKMPTVRHRKHLTIQEDDVIEFGGKIELIILGDLLFVASPRTLEFTFDFDDNISRRKEENLQAITNMNFFDEESNISVFVEKSSHYMVSRRLAGIKEPTLKALESSFKERCEELKKIKEDMPSDKKEKESYVKKYEVLWPLFDHIDVIENKVRIDSEKSIEPLLYFFSDKIVESFLTKELREAF